MPQRKRKTFKLMDYWMVPHSFVIVGQLAFHLATIIAMANSPNNPNDPLNEEYAYARVLVYASIIVTAAAIILSFIVFYLLWPVDRILNQRTVITRQRSGVIIRLSVSAVINVVLAAVDIAFAVELARYAYRLSRLVGSSTVGAFACVAALISVGVDLVKIMENRR